MPGRQITLAEVAKHRSATDAWIALNGGVYDVTAFLSLHPGGKQVLLANSGKDVSDLFKLYHNDSVLRRYAKLLTRTRVGDLVTPGERAPLPRRPLPAGAAARGSFGEMIAYGDPAWYQRLNSPHYGPSHAAWRAKVRAFVEEDVMPNVEAWADMAEPPRDVMLKAGKLGILAACTGPPYPKEYLDAGVEFPEDYDYFHELILWDEISRCGNASVVSALTNGCAIGLPAVLSFASEDMKRRVANDVLMGRKMIALAISEPQAGSNVAGLQTVARREGDHFVVNGNKKFITNGTYADYFVTAVRTGEDGHGGLSFVLVEKDTPGFSVRKLNVRGSSFSGTAYLDFDEARVPVANLIGRGNDGFKLIMYNFNHERFMLICVTTRMARICLEESIKYAQLRETFGKKLSEHPRIRAKIAKMVQQVEALQAWVEVIAYQLNTMSKGEANAKLGDIISLAKAHASRVYEICAREATHVFGGNSMVVGGPGARIEGAVNSVKAYAIPGGSEDVLEDYGARAAFKLTALASKL